MHPASTPLSALTVHPVRCSCIAPVSLAAVLSEHGQLELHANTLQYDDSPSLPQAGIEGSGLATGVSIWITGKPAFWTFDPVSRGGRGSKRVDVEGMADDGVGAARFRGFFGPCFLAFFASCSRFFCSASAATSRRCRARVSTASETNVSRGRFGYRVSGQNLARQDALVSCARLRITSVGWVCIFSATRCDISTRS